MALQIAQQFPMFSDTDGTPLNNGFIYIGTQNLNPETNQVACYWDLALTLPAAQPFRTIGGYIVRSGHPANIYVNAVNYSITVRNKNSALVYSSLSAYSSISADVVVSLIHTAPNKATPVDADEIGIYDSVTTLLNKVTWASIKATLKTYFDSLTTTLTNKTLTSPVITNPTIDQINSGQLSGFRNSFINGDYQVSQVNGLSAVTITAGAAINYAIDQWYTQSTGQNITAQQVTGASPFKYAYKLIAGATGPTTTLHGTRIEGRDCVKHVNQTIAVQVGIICDVPRTVTWTAYYANAEDNFAAKTQIATGTINATAVQANYTYTFNAGVNAGNGLCIEYTTGALTNTTGFIQYQGHQLERVSSGVTSGTSFEHVPYATQLAWCHRYLPVFNSSSATSFLSPGFTDLTTDAIANITFPVQTRVAPTGIVASSPTILVFTSTAAFTSTLITFGVSSIIGANVPFTIVGGTANQGGYVRFNTASGQIYFTGAQL